MPHTPEHNQTQLIKLYDALDSGELYHVRHMLNSLAPADVANLLESSPPKERRVLWEMVDLEHEGDVLQELSDDLQVEFLSKMDAQEVAAVTEGLEPDDIADILQQLPDTITKEVLQSMTTQDRARLESVLSYPEDTAGGLMNTDVITVRPRHTLDLVLRYLRRHNELPEMTDNLIVVNRQDEFIGILPLTKVLVTSPTITVREVMITDVEAISVHMPDTEVAQLFERHNWVSAPVIDENGKLSGRITIDDVVDVIREDADHSLMSMAGLEEDADTLAPIFKTFRRRTLWLGINLLTAILASTVIYAFDDAIEKVVAIAVLMPVIANMGGVAGSQTLTLMIRGIVLGHVAKTNAFWLLNREFSVGLLSGVCWAAALGVITYFWVQDINLAWIVGASMIITLIVAGIVGTALPMLLKSYHIDPALAGGVILTTVTDAIGFLSILGLATVFYF